MSLRRRIKMTGFQGNPRKVCCNTMVVCYLLYSYPGRYTVVNYWITVLIVSVQTNAPSLSSYYTKDFNVEIVRYVDDILRVFLSTLTERVVCFNGFLP